MHTLLSPYFVLTGRAPRLSSDNIRKKFQEVIDEHASLEEMSAMIMDRVQLLEDVHKAVAMNIATAQRKQQEDYTKRKEKSKRFPHLKINNAVKMYVPGKRRALDWNWEGPFGFKMYSRELDAADDEAARLCQLLDAAVKLWKRARRDVRVYEGEQLGGEGAPT
ncbi:hypothetical protein KC19_VG107400 [Ceratodon purpureus]|uniref:Uncharacterized protein n=1 Tax=Ceratodon purpureus TaxID=3225 RepID=A0A8T0HPP2_CERPU|nr:hypothetical protein KC19_VG107400 [Ceratodon purpureus]